ncbi:MAG: TonB-dependent receptor [Nitrospiraceae bacterium]|nr:TonB-dependent receptor [Nitrospiraceae bacterium]
MRKKLLVASLVLFSGFNSSMAAELKEPLGLGEIVVTATKTPHILKNVPVVAQVITQKDIKKTCANSVAGILKNVPGVFVQGDDIPGNRFWTATIEGMPFNAGYGLVLIDGERVRGEGMGEAGIGLNQIPPELIKKIEIVQGPSSLLYGSDAMTGVVNIITKGIPTKPTYGFGAKYGTRHTGIYNMYWGRKINFKSGLLLQATREESKMGAYGYRPKTRKESFKRTTFIGKYSYDFSDKLKFGVKLQAQEKLTNSRYLTRDTFAKFTDDKYRISPHLIANFGDSKLIVRGYYHKWYMDAHSYGNDPYPYTLRKGNMYYKDAEIRYLKPIKSNQLLTLGTEYLQSKLDYNLSHKTVDSTSAYLQDEIDLDAEKLPVSILAGIRGEHNSQYGSELCPKLAMMIVPYTGMRVRASVGRAFKAPTMRQAFYTQPFYHHGHWIVSNPDLKAEKSWGYSLGIEQQLGDFMLGNINLFRNDVKDMVIRDSIEKDIDEDGVPDSVWTYKNAQKAFTEGVGTSLKWNLIDNPIYNLLLNTSYTYTHTRNKDTKKPLPYVPRHAVANLISFNYKPLEVKTSVDVQAAGKTEDKKYSGFTTVDVKISKGFGNYGTFSVEGNNIFDSTYGGNPDRSWGSAWFAEYSINF